ncbi:MAG: MFS transporter [Candidatus Lokiarchaeota archaeon]|nr:MFS transporter [Candidatus Lokiarchaeota archaeon]MBD3338840.1 MFS transporter [Candidatus Lokiarchaeota archaeon]
MSVVEDFEEEIPLSSRLGFGLSQLSSGILGSISLVAITYYYNIILGLSAVWVSLGWVIFLVWNTLNDPIIGYLEDRIHSEKYGRRIPVIRFGAPFFALAFILCWIPLVDINNQFSLFLYFVGVLFAIDTMITIVIMIVWILPAEMAITAEGRGKLMTYGGVAQTIASLMSLALPILLFTGDQERGINLTIITFMTIIGVVCGILLFISSFYITENKFAVMDEPMGFVEGVKTTFKNKAFVLYLIPYFCFFFAQQILSTAVFYYIDFVLQVGEFLALLPILMFFVMNIIFLPVWNKIVVKIGLKKAFMSSLILMGIGFTSFFVFGWVYITAFFALMVVGAAFSGYYLMGQMVFADVVDYDEILTGKRRETTYAGIEALIQKPAISIAPAVFIWVILAFGFNEAATVQSPNAQIGIMLAFTIIPGLILFIGGISVKFYPLGGPKWIKQKEELHKKHEEKEAKYLQMLKAKDKL